ncbi:MAG: preprotein translocase subunit SecG [Bdellovibrionales bacterium]|nr:preprotein translocase subunit SecG [Bdellovibrionales bacterium]
MTVLSFFTAIYIIVAFVLITFVLLQDPKGGGAMGVFGGGGSNSLFGSTGANNFLTQVTKGSAILFAVLSILLTYLISHPGKSVLDTTTTPAAVQNKPAEHPVAPNAVPQPPEVKKEVNSGPGDSSSSSTNEKK